MTVAIIAARKGSKRLKNKNIKPFCGVPLVAWSIVQAQCSKLIDRVYLSTDGDEIADVGKAAGAVIINRPEWDDADAACSIRPFRHAIETLRLADTDTVVTLLPPHVLRKPGDLDGAIQLFNNQGYLHVEGLIPQRETILYKIIGSHVAQMEIWNKNKLYGTLCGGFWVSSVREYMLGTIGPDTDKEISTIGGGEHGTTRQYFYPLEAWQDHDTDTIEEFKLAELVCQMNLPNGLDEYREYARGEK